MVGHIELYYKPSEDICLNFYVQVIIETSFHFRCFNSFTVSKYMYASYTFRVYV